MRSRGFGVLACVFMLGLAACGGGGGGRSGSGSNPGGGLPTPTANVTVNVTSAAIAASIAQGDPYSATVSGTWSATNLGSGAVYLQVSDSAGNFTLPATQIASANGAFSYSLAVVPMVASGERTGTITVRACKDAACSNAHAGTSGSVGYRLMVTVTPAPDWETVQGNAAHNGYVPITLDSTKFAKAWEWKTPDNGTGRGYLGRPVTGNNGVYLLLGSNVIRDSIQTVQYSFLAFNESDGSQRWVQPAFPNPDDSSKYETNLAYWAGKLYSGSTSADPASGLIALDSSTGSRLFTSPSIRVFGSAMVPTPYGGNIYISERASAGLRACVAVDGANGQQLWRSTPLWEQEAVSNHPFAVAADDKHIYFYGKAGLHILDRATSNEIAVLPLPSERTREVDFDPSLVTLGNRGNALAYFYRFSEVSFQYEWFIASYSIAGRTLEWTTPSYYNSTPAVANGVIYAARAENNQVSLHALSESTGQVLWTWNAPTADAQFLVGNVVATRNFVFLSAGGPGLGSGTTWAIDLNTRQSAWSYPAAGEKAISANRMLYISHPSASGIITNEAKLIAFKLD